MNRGDPTARGLSLIETLITLVIVSAIVTLLAQALHQLRRVESLLSGGRLETAIEQVRVAWLVEALEGVTAVPLDSLQRFRGDAQRLQTSTIAVPGYPAARPGWMTLSLRKDASAASVALEMTPAHAESSAATATALLTWPGEAGRFHYRDTQGRWHERWPTSESPGVFEQLPSAIVIETGLEGARVLIVPVRSSNVAPPSRAQVMAR